MFEALKAIVLRLAKVPAEPHPPFGSPGSIRVFRAARNYWNLLLVGWAARQLAFVILLISLAVSAAAWETNSGAPRIAVVIVRLVVAGLALLFLLQAPLTLAEARLSYEMRWYMVTDRSLRLREGIFSVKETTLTFANVQNISIRQGPLQRLLGLADVVVQTAGGGGGGDSTHHSGGPRESMHTGVLRAVDEPERVRDLILERLRLLRDAGLGDPDDHHAPAHAAAGIDAQGLEALRSAVAELLLAARSLRRSG